MRKGFRQLLVLLLLVVFTSIYLNGTRLLAPTDQNSPFLSNLRYEGAGNEWNQSLFGEHGRWASMENYLRVANEYDQRRAYGLLNDTDEARYHQMFSQMARNALRNWGGYHFQKARGRAVRELDEIPGWEEIRTSKSAPVVIAGILAAAYTGRMLRYRLGSDMAVESRTILNSSRFESQYLGWSNSLLGASIGSTFDGASRNLAMSVRKDIVAGVSVSYDRQTDNDAVGMVYSTGF